MATQGQISITNTNLSGGSYSFEIYVRACGSGSWGSPIDTIPYSGFPYYFNVESVLTGSPTCYEYLVEEPTTLAQCTGQVNFGTPTPTPTKTNTPTPTKTTTLTPSPTPGADSGLTLGLTSIYTSGSTNAEFNLYSNRSVTADTYFEFTNILKTTGGTEVILEGVILIPEGLTSGSTLSKLPARNYNDIQKGYSVITDFTSNGEDFIIDRYASVEFEGMVAPNVRYIFRDCCGFLSNIEIVVPNQAVTQGGWVTLGQVIVYNGNCYVPFGPGGLGTQLFSGPDYSSCLNSNCACVTPVSVTPTKTPTPTPTKTPNLSSSLTPTTTPTPTVTPSAACSECSSDFIDCEEAMDCFSYISGDSPTPTPTQTATPTSTPVSPTPTPTITPTPTLTPSALDCLTGEGYLFDTP
jgi:hypothetical protein